MQSTSRIIARNALLFTAPRPKALGAHRRSAPELEGARRAALRDRTEVGKQIEIQAISKQRCVCARARIRTSLNWTRPRSPRLETARRADSAGMMTCTSCIASDRSRSIGGQHPPPPPSRDIAGRSESQRPWRRGRASGACLLNAPVGCRGAGAPLGSGQRGCVAVAVVLPIGFRGRRRRWSVRMALSVVGLSTNQPELESMSAGAFL